MKVCTDTLLFGASLPIMGGESVIDIGAGTGILSLMAIQQGAGHATAVELTPEAASDCRENFLNSPWANQLCCIEGDIQSFNPSQRYDRVISNPPFFFKQQKSTNQLRRTARHDDSLSFAELLIAADQLMTDSGILCLLLPYYERDNICCLADEFGLQLDRLITLRSRASSAIKLAIFWFSRSSDKTLSESEIVVYDAYNQYTAQSSHYLKNYLLRFRHR